MLPTWFRSFPREQGSNEWWLKLCITEDGCQTSRGALTVEVLVEYLQICLLMIFISNMTSPIIISGCLWGLVLNGCFLLGPWFFASCKWVWKSWATLCCKFFIWSAIKGRCWTKRGLPHPSVCPVCDQADETIKHTLVACVSTRQVWTAIFHVLGLLPLTFLAGGAKQSRLFQKS